MPASPIFTLRNATPTDAPLFYSVIDKTMCGFIVATWGAWNEERVQQESRRDSCSPDARVIQVGDIPAGVFVVERHPAHIQLKQLYLLPEYQKQWIGLSLVGRPIAESARNKLPLRLHVLAVNSAKKFYEKFGFVVAEARSNLFFIE